MKIRLLIATKDKNYAQRLSAVMAEKYTDTFDVNVCSTTSKLDELLANNKYDATLLEPGFAAASDFSSAGLLLSLIDESGVMPDDKHKPVQKYQRVSKIAGNILENYAETGKGISDFGKTKARLTAVWSAGGGTGKTTIALAFAANQTLTGKQAVYLNLEDFSSTPAFFTENGRSVSKVFEKLNTNVSMLLEGIRQQDTGSGIMYFNSPDNYDDMNILTSDDIVKLIDACATGVDEVIIDLPARCDNRVQAVFEIASKIMIVCDPSIVTQAKLKQFMKQHNIFENIKDKLVLINNKGANMQDMEATAMINLPFISSADPVAVYKSLSGANFNI